MAFSSPTFLAVVLTLLALGVMSGTQANPVEQSDTPNDLEITKDGKPIENGAVVRGTAGEEFELICIVQGYNPLAVSWWEGGAELESVLHKSTYATSNVLSVKAITVDDSRRTFTCRSRNGQLSKTVTLEVHEVSVLDITSSIKLDKPIFGDKFGPFTAGQELTLICSTKASDSVSLSWWEGDTEQQSSPKVDDGLISSSFTIQTLRIKDNGRRFSCKDQQTQAIKHIEISVETDAPTVLEVIKYDEAIEDGTVVGGTEGKDDPLIYMLVIIGIPSLFIFLLLVIILFIFYFCCNKKLTKGKQDSVSKGYKDSSAEIKNDSSRKTSKQHKHDRLSQKPLCQQEEV